MLVFVNLITLTKPNRKMNLMWIKSLYFDNIIAQSSMLYRSSWLCAECVYMYMHCYVDYNFMHSKTYHIFSWK